LAPFTDGGMYADFKNRSKFWKNESFYGVNLSSMKEISEEQIFRQPVVGGFDPKTLMSSTVSKSFEFYKEEINGDTLKYIRIPFEFLMEYTGVIHGIAGWFNVSFPNHFTLETGPEHQRTHWQQCRFFFRKPIGVNYGQCFKGALEMKVNEERSYTVLIEGKINDIEVKELFALHEQQYFNLSPTEYSKELSSEYYNLY
jgi:type I protein arginine methyltransferase